MRSWLEQELNDAEAVLSGYLAEAKGIGLDIEQSPIIRYWVGYVDAITNCLNEYDGPGATE